MWFYKDHLPPPTSNVCVVLNGFITSLIRIDTYEVNS